MHIYQTSLGTGLGLKEESSIIRRNTEPDCACALPISSPALDYASPLLAVPLKEKKSKRKRKRKGEKKKKEEEIIYITIFLIFLKRNEIITCLSSEV
jgi:hypothetical protein